jgi:hypothetical protein
MRGKSARQCLLQNIHTVDMSRGDDAREGHKVRVQRRKVIARTSRLIALV